MKKTLQSSGATNKRDKFDYFEYAKNNPDKGRVLTYAEFLKMIEGSRIEKMKKAS